MDFKTLLESKRNESLKKVELLKQGFPFPEKLDKSYCEETTRRFALTRLGLENVPERWLNYHIQKEPILGMLISEYPLPMDVKTLFNDLKTNDVYPFVEREFSRAGIVERFENNGTVGYFVGLVQKFIVTESDKVELDGFDIEYQLANPIFRFVEGMILLEGNLDELVIRQLKDFEKHYNKHILGKIVTGRPRSDPEYWLEPARAKIQEKPDITQDDLAYEIGCDLKTFKINRKNGGFATYKEFKDSILKP